MTHMSSSQEPPSMHEGATLSDIHSDILETHVLTRLDGATLASLSCTSSQLYKLSSHDSLWTNICHSTWPSTTTPILRSTIASFDGGARSFVSGCFPSTGNTVTARIRKSSESCKNSVESTFNPERLIKLISGVDLYYRGEVIISRVVETETVSSWFRCSPFRVDLLDPKDVLPTPIRYPSGMGYEKMCKDVENDLSLSWILVDPIGRRVMNLSSEKVVSVQRHWLTGELHVRFAIILEHVMCEILVTCGGWEDGGGGMMMQVREVSLQVEDLDGVHLNGRDSLEILGRGLEGKTGNGNRGKMAYKEFLDAKMERRERKLRREGWLDSLCVSFGILVFGVFWMLILFR